MPTQPEAYFTPEEYLAMERKAETKSEYHAGRIYALAGASESHVLIASNLVVSLGAQLRGRPCRVYASDMRVKVTTFGMYTYPDVVVVCGQGRFEDTRRDTLLNPTVIVEVLSPSTEGYDRGRKFEFIVGSSRSPIMSSSRKIARSSSTTCACPMKPGCSVTPMTCQMPRTSRPSVAICR